MANMGLQFNSLTSATAQSDAQIAYSGVDMTSSSTPRDLSSVGNFSTKPTQGSDGFDIHDQDMNSGASPDCEMILSHVAGPPPLYSDPVRIVISVILICVPILTVFGNGVVILAVITHKRLRNITNAFIVSLAVADMCVALFVMPFSIYQQINNKQWFLGEILCKLSSSLDVMMCTVSIFHLSCLAVDRYLAICRPFLHERLTVRLISIMLVLCWIIPVFISFIPILNEWNLIGIEDIVKCAFPIEANICVFIVNVPFAIICSLIAFYIPVVFMGVCNVKIYMAAIKQAHQIRTLEAAGSHNHYSHCKRKSKFKQESKAAKTLSIIMGCFSVCWFPFFIMNIIDPFIRYSTPYVPWQIALWLGYINSLINPLLYYNFNRNFYHAFRRLLSCKVCKGVRDYEEDMLNTQMSE
ncbi:5-hydroxytryptamine receptor 4 [Plakobranchus ocellatus]|uniref:5-hydroxytryptamine receptor 4 n=1 Tax=Plakobranchus ocellatus TaxID=259542 RepID=A0AAV3Y0A5_9GAST|nr:5-hydroxytryptamine receptor 4 [Plakobranchus ocellatus]